MKFSKAQMHSRVHRIPTFRFEDRRLTSFAGLVVIQELFGKLDLKNRLRSCFDHLPTSPVFGYPVIVMVLIVQLLLGHRRLRDMDYYRDDLMVLRLLGLRRMPDVSTVSRALACIDATGIEKLRQLCREMLLTQLQGLALARVTLDFERVGHLHRQTGRRHRRRLQPEEEGAAELLSVVLHYCPDGPGL